MLIDASLLYSLKQLKQRRDDCEVKLYYLMAQQARFLQTISLLSNRRQILCPRDRTQVAVHQLVCDRFNQSPRRQQSLLHLQTSHTNSYPRIQGLF